MILNQLKVNDIAFESNIIRLDLVKHLLNHCSLLNIDRSMLLRAGGISDLELNGDDQYISFEVLEKMITYLCGNITDQLLILKFFQKCDFTAEGVLGLLLTVSASLKQAVDSFNKYRWVNGNVGFVNIEHKGDIVYFRWKTISKNINYIRVSTVYKFAWWSNLIKMLGVGDNGYIKYINLKHSAKSKEVNDYYNNFFGCPVYFDQNEYSMVISSESLNVKLRTANRDLYLTIENYIKSLLEQYSGQKLITDKVRKLIYEQLRVGVVSRERTAEYLGMNVRTLTRKLYSEGTKYSLILEEVRISVAKDYLENHDLSIYEISKLLGFFTSNAFITWFKRLQGETPRRYREKKSINNMRSPLVKC